MLSSHHKVTREEADELVGITSFREDTDVEQPEPAQKKQRRQASEPPPHAIGKEGCHRRSDAPDRSGASSSSSSSGSIQIRKEVLVQAIGPSNDFANGALS